MNNDDALRERVEKSLGPIRDMPALTMDYAAIGQHLVRLVATSAMLGHAEPQNTICYFHGMSDEVQFIRDVMTHSTAELVERWFGGEGYDGGQGATRLMSFLNGEALKIHDLSTGPAA